MINNNYILNNFSILFFVNNIFMIMLLFTIILLFINFVLSIEKKIYNVNIIFELLKLIYIFVYSNLITNLSLSNLNKNFSFYFYLFLFIMIINIIGILPYSFAITSHFFITYSLSFIVCYSNLFIGFNLNGLNFFSIFYAKGVPFLLIPFLIIIELISYLFRSISLALRLFANLVAGHILLDTLNLTIFKLLFYNKISIIDFIFILIPILFSIVLLIFEIFVAILQAYIFVILSIIFLRDNFVSH